MREAFAAGIAFAVALALALVVLPSPEAEEAVPDDRGRGALLTVGPTGVASGSLEAPTWRVGEAWRVRFEPSGFDCTLVVADAAEGYLLAPTCPELAVEDAVFDHEFYGRLTTGLGGILDDGAVEFFSWPLVDNKTWTTRWGGSDVEVRARFVPDLLGPAGREPGFSIVAAFDDEAVAIWDYVPSLGWWSGLHSAQSDFAMVVVERLPRVEGVAYDASARQVADVNGQLQPPAQFTLGEHENVLSLFFRWDGVHASRAVLTRPDGQLEMGPQFGSGGGTYWWRVNGMPGPWTYQLAGGTFTGPPMRTLIHAVALQEMEIGPP